MSLASAVTLNNPFETWAHSSSLSLTFSTPIHDGRPSHIYFTNRTNIPLHFLLLSTVQPDGVPQWGQIERDLAVSELQEKEVRTASVNHTRWYASQKSSTLDFTLE